VLSACEKQKVTSDIVVYDAMTEAQVSTGDSSDVTAFLNNTIVDSD
jgi:hypothetical protein